MTSKHKPPKHKGRIIEAKPPTPPLIPPPTIEPPETELEKADTLPPVSSEIDRLDAEEESFLSSINAERRGLTREPEPLADIIKAELSTLEPDLATQDTLSELEAPADKNPRELIDAAEGKKPHPDPTPEPKRYVRPARGPRPRARAAAPDPRVPTQVLPPESRRAFLGLLDFRSPKP